MIVAVVYTSTTPELTQMLARHLAEAFSGVPLEIRSYSDPSILQEARERGGVTPGCARRLLDLYEKGAKEGADILLNACSSVGGIAALCKPLYEAMGLGFVRIDEEMAFSACRAGSRIGVIATLRTTLEPTRRLLLRCAQELNKPVTLVDGLAEGAFGLDQAQFREKLIATGRLIRDRVDVLLFAQGSMAYAEEDVCRALEIPVFSSIRFGAQEVRKTAERLLRMAGLGDAPA